MIFLNYLILIYFINKYIKISNIIIFFLIFFNFYNIINILYKYSIIKDNNKILLNLAIKFNKDKIFKILNEDKYYDEDIIKTILKFNNYKILRILLEEYNIIINNNYKILIYRICFNNYFETMEILLNNINFTKQELFIFLLISCKNNSNNIIKLLLKQKKIIINNLALSICINNNNFKIVNLILKRNLNINFKNMYESNLIKKININNISYFCHLENLKVTNKLNYFRLKNSSNKECNRNWKKYQLLKNELIKKTYYNNYI